jgi:hypothetical protein
MLCGGLVGLGRRRCCARPAVCYYSMTADSDGSVALRRRVLIGCSERCALDTIAAKARRLAAMLQYCTVVWNESECLLRNETRGVWSAVHLLAKGSGLCRQMTAACGAWILESA